MKNVLFVFLVILLAACEKEVKLTSIKVHPDQEIYVGDQTKLQVIETPVDAVAPSKYIYKTSDKYIATVDDEGVVTSHHVGTCTIFVATADKYFSTQCTINVNAKNNLYEEPIVDFSSTKASVKLKESARTILHEADTLLIYSNNKEPVSQIIYVFDKSRKLVSSGVLLIPGEFSEFTGFLAERYDRMNAERGMNYLLWRGPEMEVTAKLSNEAVFIIYSPYSGSTTYGNSINIINTLRPFVN